MNAQQLLSLVFGGGADFSSMDESDEEKEARRRREVLARWRQSGNGPGRNYSQGFLEVLPPIMQAQVLGISSRFAVEEQQQRQRFATLAKPSTGRALPYAETFSLANALPSPL